MAALLRSYAGTNNAIVLALPRGGVPVGAAVARALRLSLDVFVVRKLGLPGQPELAMGAIATGGVRVLNDDVIDSLQLPDRVIDTVAERESRELARREKLYRGERPMPDVAHKIVILVDDGIATGSTMLAAIRSLRILGAEKIIVATPVIAHGTLALLESAADDVVSVLTPYDFYGVGQWYENFTQTTDDEVRALLGENERQISAE